MRDNDAIEKLHADIEAGWQQVEDGKVSEFDPEAVKHRGREKLAALRAAIREGLGSGPAEPFDMETILAEARASGPADPEIDKDIEFVRQQSRGTMKRFGIEVDTHDHRRKNF